MSLLYILLTFCPATLAERNGFTVCYDTQDQRALWTAHKPMPSTAPTPRKHWRKDYELNSLPAKAFTNTGFDRGHLASSADLPESEDTFLTSNAVAQNRALNECRGRNCRIVTTFSGMCAAFAYDRKGDCGAFGV